MLKSSLCNYSDVYMLIKGIITTAGAEADVTARHIDRKKQVTFKNCAPFTDFLSKINNIPIDVAKDLDVVTPIYNLIEYSDNYAKTSGSLWKYLNDDPNDNITHYESFKFKLKITGRIPAAGST